MGGGTTVTVVEPVNPPSSSEMVTVEIDRDRDSEMDVVRVIVESRDVCSVTSCEVMCGAGVEGVLMCHRWLVYVGNIR